VSATETQPSGAPLGHSSDSMSAGDMRRRGVVLLAGAVGVVLLVKPIGSLEYYWNPLLVGLAFLAAAAFTGRRSPLFGAGLVVTSWGVATAMEQSVKIGWAGGMTMIAIGLGGLIAAYLGTRGWAVSPASVAWPVVFIGLGQFVYSNSLESGLITWYTAGLALVYGAAELINSARQGDRRSSYTH
jgi:hypothetical protein